MAKVIMDQQVAAAEVVGQFVMSDSTVLAFVVLGIPRRRRVHVVASLVQLLAPLGCC